MVIQSYYSVYYTSIGTTALEKAARSELREIGVKGYVTRRGPIKHIEKTKWEPNPVGGPES